MRSKKKQYPQKSFPPYPPALIYASNAGLDLTNGKVRNNIEAGVLEPAMSKVKMIKFATEAAITILRIDELITLNPKQEPDHGDH